MNDTGERIINAALKLFAQKGFEATSIRDIAEEANINSATLYYYINNKEEFLFSLMRYGLGEIITIASEIVLFTKRPEERLAALVQLHVVIHGKRQLLTLVTDREFTSLHGEYRQKIKALRKEYEEIWVNTIGRGVAEGVFTTVSDIKLTSIALLEMCTSVAHWYSPNGRLSLMELSDEFANMALNLVGGERNGKRITLEDLNLPNPMSLIHATLEFEGVLKH